MLRRRVVAALGWALFLSVPSAAAPASLTASINLGQQTMTVSENGQVVASWPISSGTAQFPTPRGVFRAQRTEKIWYSRKYDNAPMPNAVFINGGVAVHGTVHVKSLGRPASHGCIRLAPGHAAQFYSMVKAHGLGATKVTVFGNPSWGSQIANRNGAKRTYAEQNDGYWFSGSYEPSSAYAPNFAKRKGARVIAPRKSQKVDVQDNGWIW